VSITHRCIRSLSFDVDSGEEEEEEEEGMIPSFFSSVVVD
jgi:hypothetical protein